jgi:type IV pilus assembly protein PilB
MDNEKIKSILGESGLVEQDLLNKLFLEAQRKGMSLYELIVSRDILPDFYLGRALAEGLKYPFVSLSRVSIPEDVLEIVPEIVAKNQKIIAFEMGKDGLKLAMAEPSNYELKEFVEKKVGVPVTPYFATERDLNNALVLYRKDVGKTLEEILSDITSGKAEGDGPLVKMVDELFLSANRNKASDIHIEPYEKMTIIRFRVDGVLHEVATLPKKYHEQIVSRIKILSKLKTDEHLSAQDGKLQFVADGENVDVRVSVVPIVEGEKVVLRLLSAKSRQFSLEELGLSPEDMVKVQRGFSKPWGMVLATGPTGSGKTTTIYAVLKIINRPEVNIATIEDPVEYDIEGINQIQVNPKTNLTFAKGLGSILRQDPDIIFVGEIRDEETAGIAINAAMTGHLVLSTLHTNDAATTLPRLADMGIEPFLITSAVNVALAQRLIRKICPSCIVSTEVQVKEGKIITKTGVLPVEQKLLDKYFPRGKTLRVYEGKGCPVCKHTGYVGRTGIFEVLEVTPAIRELIMAKANSEIIMNKAVAEGMTTMFEDGIRKVSKGITTIEEVMRAVKT